jgi:adenylate cyclase
MLQFYRRRAVQLLIPGLVLALGLILQVSGAPWLDDLRGKTFDMLQRVVPRPYVEAPVRIVDLDDASLERHGQWPWPRTLIAQLVGRLAKAGAAAIAFDIVFAEPDRTSPAQIIPFWPRTPKLDALRENMQDLPDNDRILADAIAAVPVILGFVLTPQEGGRIPQPKAGFAVAGTDAARFVPRFYGAVSNLEVLEKAARGNGGLNIVPEHDGVVRRVPLLLAIGDQLRPSLATEALRVAQGARSYTVKTVGASGLGVFTTQIGVAEVRDGKLIVPTDENGQIILYDTGAVPGRSISAATVLSDQFEPSAIAGRIVLVGTSAAGLKDLRATPLQDSVPGVEVHAQLIEQIISQTFLRRPAWTAVAELLFPALFGITLILLVAGIGPAWGALIALGVGGLAVIGTWQAFIAGHLLLAPILPVGLIALVYLSAAVTSYLRADKERRQVRSAFSRYMSPVLVARLAANPSQLKLGGEERVMSVMFCDIRGFTTISEHFRDDPEGLTFLLNRYFTAMTDRILEYGGTIDKYMGDAVMAFWNAPLADENHARNCCEGALEMLGGVRRVNQHLAKAGEERGKIFPPITIGIGLNTGLVLVGNLGSAHRFSYSVIGDGVNLAARLEGQTKTYGCTIVMGESTYEQVKDFATLELDLIRVKGKDIPSRVYALLGLPRVQKGAAFQALQPVHDQLLAAYRRGDWVAARALLPECRTLGAAFRLDRLYTLFEERIGGFERDPPPADWDGVYTAKSK